MHNRFVRLFFALGLYLSSLIVSLTATADEISCRQLLSNSGRTAYSYYSSQTSQFYDIYRGYTPEQIYKISQLLTQMHADRDMSFQVKNPKTGIYDKSVAVPVNAIIAPIEKSKFDGLVASTQPVMQTLRRILQRIYSGQDITPQNLGLNGLNETEAALFIQIIKSSIYLEPQLMAPQMAEYPFLSIAGWDGAIGNPENPNPYFFELNLGTPSGLSNNIQLLSYLQKADPKTYELIKNYLPADQTFYNLRRVIDSNARKWTRNPVGISVVISPGIYNGAHPDVAAIAALSRMPLVETSDLYEDASGAIRLNTGNNIPHPVVTGIYGRMEESFFLQSSELGVPMISPGNNNQELSKKIGIPLRRGAIYKYVYSDNGEIIDVERGANGQPLLQDVWAQMGSDPSRPDAPRGQFLKAILNRKLYYSALGGRVVDDKRLFGMISQKLTPRRTNGEKTAGPVPSLERAQFNTFFAFPDKFVVKEPNNSGGVGVYFVNQLPQTEKEKLIEQVRTRPDDFEIQYVSDVATLPTAVKKNDSLFIDEVATDLRLFVMMDGEGNVSADPHSLLFRTAPYGSLYSNTSRGGGYGIGVVYEKTKRLDGGKNNLPQHTPPPFIAGSKVTQYYQLLRELKFRYIDIILRGTEDADLKSELKSDAFELAHKIRAIMDILPAPGLMLIEPLRKISGADSITAQDLNDLKKLIAEFYKNLYSNQKDLHPRMQEVTHDFFSLEGDGLPIEKDPLKSLSDLDISIADLVETEMFPQPEITYTYQDEKDGYQKIELGAYKRVDNPEIQKLIDEVRSAGGEVRLLKARSQGENKEIHLSWHPPYFWVNTSMPQLSSYLKPVIAIDLTQDRALAGLEHEMSHFRDWKKSYDLYLSQGLSHQEAATKAQNDNYEPDSYVEGERRALDAEIKSEIEFSEHRFNQGRSPRRAHFFYEFRYVNRMTYPEFEGAKELLRRRKHNQPIDQEQLNKYLRHLVSFSAESKLKAMDFLKEYLLSGQKGALDGHLSKNIAEYYLSSWNNNSLLELIIYPYGIERLVGEGIYNEFVTEFRRVAKELGYTQKSEVWADARKGTPPDEDEVEQEMMTGIEAANNETSPHQPTQNGQQQ